MRTLPAKRTPSAPPAIARLQSQARDFITAARSENTARAYRSDWADFTAWCSDHGAEPLPAAPDTIALYITDRAATCKPSTIQRRIVAISQAHQAAGYDTPTTAAVVRTVWRGIRRTVGTAYEQKNAATIDIIRAMVGTLPATVAGCRDRAILLLGFAGAFRRSELVALDMDDLDFHADGVTVTIRRGKTDQEAAGRMVGIPYGRNPKTCPVRALVAWIEELSETTGPVFRAVTCRGNIAAARLSDRSVALTVKKAAKAAGYDPAGFAGHSLRSGLATSAAAAGVAERDIMAQTGHTSERMVRRYIRAGSLYRHNAAAAVGL